MAPGPLFHIGYHRTATTWFQQVFYPAVRNGTFVPREQVRATLIEPRAFAFDPQIARAALLGATSADHLLACEENLSGYIHNGALGGLVSREAANRICAAFPEARIVVMLRSQPDIITASYAQYVRAGGTHDFKRYLGVRARSKGAAKYWYKAPAFDFDHFRYGPLLAHYRALFGAQRIHVRLYEDFRNNPLAFLQGFSGDLGLDADVGSLRLDKVNASLAPHQLRILRRLNLFTARSVQNKQALLDREDWYERRWVWLTRIERLWRGKDQPARLTLPRRVAARMDELYGEDNAQIAAQWGLSLAGHGYPVRA